MQQWEYCYISGIRINGSFETSYPRITRFSSKNPFIEKVELGKKPHNEEIFGVAESIAKLGEEGWEMVSAATLGSTVYFTLFFKRLKE
jgi:hypothetical protein